MKTRILLLAGLPVVALACGPFFYDAPPTLDRYPERLPVKTMRELMREKYPVPAEAATYGDLLTETTELARNLTTAKGPATLTKIDELLERNRTGDYRKRFANCLYDLRDLVSDGAAAEAATSGYIETRLAWMSSDDGTVKVQRTFSEDDQSDEAKAARENAAGGDARWRELPERPEKASPALKPHWLVLLGARQFRSGDFAEAAKVFASIVESQPKHPRAEVAQLMLGRCYLEQWRAVTDKENVDEDAAKGLAEKCDTAFEDYLKAYPQGRYALDVPGWRVDLARQQGELKMAFTLLLQQMDANAHPEIIRRAAQEMDRILEETDLGAEFDDDREKVSSLLPFDELGRRPLAALALVYHFLDARSRFDFEEWMSAHEGDENDVMGDLVPVLRMRRAGRVVLPKLVEAVAANRDAFGQVWRPRYLAVLAWAASEAGDHRQAVGLCELAGPALMKSDDLGFARAVALQRAGDLPKAREALEELRTRFPKSPLRAEYRFRLATVLRDSGEGGLAALELIRMQAARADEDRAERKEGDQQDAGTPNDTVSLPPPGKQIPPLHLPEEIRQWTETLLSFSPLDQLERGWTAAKDNEETAERFREVLRNRHLAAEHFAEAVKFSKPDEQTRPMEKEGYPPTLAGAEWSAVVEKLKKLTQAVAAGAGSAAAQTHFDLAETWAKARARLIEGDGKYGDADRQRNAQAMGLTREAAARETESRDELRHALPHYLAAAELGKGTPLAVQALERANEALRMLAQSSDWAAGRAFETEATAVSRQLYEKLQQAQPKAGKKRGNLACWSFVPAAEKPWSPQSLEDPAFIMEPRVLFTFEHPGAGEKFEKYGVTETKYDQWDTRLAELADTAEKTSPAKLLQTLEKMRGDFRADLVDAHGAAVLNVMDDLITFLHEPKLTPKAVGIYFRNRVAEAPTEELASPAMAPWKDYVDFRRAVETAQAVEDRAERRQRMVTEMQGFLQMYPKSRKREAAMARLAMNLARIAHGHAGVDDLIAAELPAISGGQTIEKEGGDDEQMPAARAAVAAYEKEFPNGRYLANVRMWRGALAVDAHDWATGLRDLTATLDDPQQRDLHQDAALNLGYALLQLLDQPDQRGAIVDALETQPAAQKRLWQFMHSETPGARLGCLEGYLREQF